MIPLIHWIQDAYRRHLRVAAYAVFGVSLASLCYLAWSYHEQSQSLVEREPDSVSVSTTTITTTPTTPLATSVPQRLVIPTLGIDAAFEEPLGLHPDGTVDVPKEYTTVGWYSGSPTPGSLGPSVILGHVDSYEGPAVFYSLGQLAPGDRFTVLRADGTRPEFVVERLERYSQNAFPTEQVYGPIDHAGIRLITCSGTYDRASKRYTHNLVVYGRLAEPQ
jgi:hypothetical protein